MKTFDAKKLLAWYERDRRRAYPWRLTRDPYRIWVSEIMLQQTQTPRVVAFYKNFIKKFSSIRRLAAARWPSVLSVVRGLGYYRRFRNMQATARKVAQNFSGKFPGDFTALRKLPGIGEYTANALLAFAFEKDVAVIDTNVRQVLQSLYGAMDADKLREKAIKLCPKGRARDFFQAMMDYASEQRGRRQNRAGFAHKVPLLKKKKLALMSKRALAAERANRRWPKNARSVAAAIIRHNGKILIQKRQKGRHLAGFWEFPGGKIEPGENARQCLKREIQEELGIEISVRPAFFETIYAYDTARRAAQPEPHNIRLSFHRCQILLGSPRSREGQIFRWVAPPELKNYKFPPADTEVVSFLCQTQRLTRPTQAHKVKRKQTKNIF